jgi:hypothetical protein
MANLSEEYQQINSYMATLEQALIFIKYEVGHSSDGTGSVAIAELLADLTPRLKSGQKMRADFGDRLREYFGERFEEDLDMK